MVFLENLSIDWQPLGYLATKPAFLGEIQSQGLKDGGVQGDCLHIFKASSLTKGWVAPPHMVRSVTQL